MPWNQIYNPVAGNILWSALVAAIPVVVLLGLLAFFHMRAHLAAIIGLASSLLVAIFIYQMPVSLALASAANGAAYGLFPIGWIVLCAIFIYDITVETGQFEIIRATVANLASDDRIQALIIAFSFGAFIEGAAGFGTPVAISAAMLIGLGFKPLLASGIALIGNTAPVAFGALGTPVIALAKVTGLPLEQLSAMIGRQLPFFSVIVPFWLVWAMSGRKKMWEVWPACLTCGLSFAIVQFLVSNYHGPWVVDIAASIASIIALLILLKFWQPREVVQQAEKTVVARPSTSAALRAWMPWIILSVVVFVWGLPQVKAWLNSFSLINITVPFLHNMVQRTPPVVAVAKAEEAIFAFNWLSATGTGLLISALISGLLLGLKPAEIDSTFWQYNLARPLFAHHNFRDDGDWIFDALRRIGRDNGTRHLPARAVSFRSFPQCWDG